MVPVLLLAAAALVASPPPVTNVPYPVSAAEAAQRFLAAVDVARPAPWLGGTPSDVGPYLTLAQVQAKTSDRDGAAILMVCLPKGDSALVRSPSPLPEVAVSQRIYMILDFSSPEGPAVARLRAVVLADDLGARAETINAMLGIDPDASGATGAAGGGEPGSGPAGAGAAAGSGAGTTAAECGTTKPLPYVGAPRGDFPAGTTGRAGSGGAAAGKGAGGSAAGGTGTSARGGAAGAAQTTAGQGAGTGQAAQGGGQAQGGQGASGQTPGALPQGQQAQGQAQGQSSGQPQAGEPGAGGAAGNGAEPGLGPIPGTGGAGGLPGGALPQGQGGQPAVNWNSQTPTQSPEDPTYEACVAYWKDWSAKYNPRLTDLEREALVRWVLYYAAYFGVDHRLVFSVMRWESGFDPGCVSRAGAIGLMQVMPATAKDQGIDPWVVEQNIRCGICELSGYLDDYSGRANFEQCCLALACYNAGPNRVKRCGGIPAIPETENYVRRVTDTFADLVKSGAP